MKRIFALITVIFAIYAMTLSLHAEDGVTVPESFSEMLDALPDELEKYMPEGLFSTDSAAFSETVAEMLSPEQVIETCLELIGVKLSENLKLLEICLACVLLSALLRRLGDMFVGKNVKPAFEFCTRLCIFSAVITSGYTVIEGINGYFDNLTALMTAAVPAVGALYSIGGNVGAAVSGSAGITLSLSVCGGLCAKAVMPVFCISMAAVLADLFGGISMSPIANLFKKSWLWLMGIITFVMTTAIGLQTVVSSKSDSLGMKGAKYAIGSIIPTVGGTVSGTLGTVAASVELIRSSAGIATAVIILMMLLQSVVSLIITRFVFGFAGGASELLGCSGEARLFSELSGIYGYLVAAECIVSAVFIIQFAILAGCASAY